MSSYIVGRSPSADIRIMEDNSVSNQHLRISFIDGRWLVEDLNSTNGTYLEQRLGKTKVSRQYVEGTDYIILGNYKVKVADLIRKIEALQPPPSAAQPSPQNQAKNPEFSRYLKAEDGRFVRRKK